MSKITVIGAGNVGATIANDLMIQGIASEIVLIDINRPKAFGEALDIYQGVPYCAPAIVRSGDYPAAADSDIVVITSGMPRKAGQSRLELAQVNVNIMKDIASKIVPVAPNALYVIVSNPVDVLTYVFHKVSGVPENHIIGSGTILDTRRLQAALVPHQPEERPRARLRRAWRFVLRALVARPHRKQPHRQLSRPFARQGQHRMEWPGGLC